MHAAEGSGSILPRNLDSIGDFSDAKLKIDDFQNVFQEAGSTTLFYYDMWKGFPSYAK